MLTLVVEIPMLKMKTILKFSSFQFCISDFFYVSLQQHTRKVYKTELFSHQIIVAK